MKEQTQKPLLGGNTERRAKGVGVDRKSGHAGEPGQVVQVERVEKNLAVLKRREPTSPKLLWKTRLLGPLLSQPLESASLRQSPRNVWY